MKTKFKSTKDDTSPINVDDALADFKLACLSREMSFLLRKEVLTGKAKFGIAGAGKEIPLIAAGKTFQKGDYWAGYYRDQTTMLAKGLLSPQSYFTALYGDAENDLFSGGRQMNNHFSTPMLDSDGNWLPQSTSFNVSSPVSSLASNVPRALGLALASKSYKNNTFLNGETPFSNDGSEVTFCVLGDATTSEGIFFESVNAAGVMQIPIAFIILDDGYGISVPSEYQTTKGDISKVLEGFKTTPTEKGIDIYTCKAWDYGKLVRIFREGIREVRETQTPAIFHIKECTQPQGHSTSGSHQRYKSKERLQWEKDFDGIRQLKNWIIKTFEVEVSVLEEIEKTAKEEVIKGRDQAWRLFTDQIHKSKSDLIDILKDLKGIYHHYKFISSVLKDLESQKVIDLSEQLAQAKRLRFHFSTKAIATENLDEWISRLSEKLETRYSTHLYHKGRRSALKVPHIEATYEEDAPLLNGYQILNKYFDQLLRKDPRVYAFGEDVGRIGDVNQAFAGLQEKYGENRVFDTGIREWSIVGQGIGMAMRGLRPIAEIQYLDYLAYAFPPLTDDLSTLHYRSKGRQAAPAIIRTRGHRLEGIWHSGSPMGMLLSSMRGLHILTPRNMTQAAGMYNTLLQSIDPALMIECLNGYRKKEKLPSNLGEFTVPLGVPEILRSGGDVTVVSYGSTLHIAAGACERLAGFGVDCELIDVQTLLPFDLENRILESLKKTSRLVLIDEDVPGGATAFMLQEILERQKGYFFLDRPPLSISSKAHRPAYGNDGDYTSKPNAEEVFQKIYNLVNETENIR